MMGDMRLNKPWFCVKEGINFNLTCYQALLLSECGILLIREAYLIQHPVKCDRENQHDTHTDGLNTLFE